MTHPISQLPTRCKKDPQLVHVVIETPKGSRNKYDWKPDLGVFLMSKVLPEGHVFPYDFGFIPGTVGEDGDPLDVLVFTDAPVGFPGCLVEVRLVGAIEAEQTERDGKTVRNDRLLAVAQVSRTHESIEQAKDLAPYIIEEIERFFVSYNEQAGKTFTSLGAVGTREAERVLKDGMERAQKSSS